MSKVAIVSDIHGNLHALRAVLREVGNSGAKLLAVAGDIIGYGANPRECVDLLQKVGAQAVFGNHESYAVLIQREGMAALEADWQSSPVYARIVHAIRGCAFRPGATTAWCARQCWDNCHVYLRVRGREGRPEHLEITGRSSEMEIFRGPGGLNYPLN